MENVTFDEKNFNDNVEAMFERMIDAQGEACKAEMDGQQEEKTRVSIEELLKKLNKHISSRDFNKMIDFKAKEMKVNRNIVKHVYAANMLDRVGSIFGISIQIVGNAMKLLTRFISYMISNICNIAVGVLVRVANVLTFRTVPVA